MGKVFRLFKDGANTYNDWNASPDYPYDSTNRDTIIDPEGATASKEITSIPSPFARIDLVRMLSDIFVVRIITNHILMVTRYIINLFRKHWMSAKSFSIFPNFEMI